MFVHCSVNNDCWWYCYKPIEQPCQPTQLRLLWIMFGCIRWRNILRHKPIQYWNHPELPETVSKTVFRCFHWKVRGWFYFIIVITPLLLVVYKILLYQTESILLQTSFSVPRSWDINVSYFPWYLNCMATFSYLFTNVSAVK